MGPVPQRKKSDARKYDWLTIPHQTLPRCSAGELMELWKLADRKKGVPVLLKVEDTLEEMLQMNSYEDGPLPDLDQYLEPRIQAVLTDGEYAFPLGAPGDVGGGIDRFLSFSFHDRNEVVLAFVPAKEPWDVFRHLPIGGWNDCPAPNVITAFCRELYRDFGAVPAVISGDTLELVSARRPTHEEAFPLALKMYAFCPDIVTQGLGSVWALANCLEQSDVWYFWWD